MSLILPAREIVSLEQQERERLVKEETTLSKRVDGLRELGLSEEQKLREWQEREYKRHLEKVEKRESDLQKLDDLISAKKKEVEAFYGPLDTQWALFKQVEKGKIEDEQREQKELRTDLFLKMQEHDIRAQELDKQATLLKQQKLRLVALSNSVKDEQIKAESESNGLLAKSRQVLEEAEADRAKAIEVREDAETILRDVKFRSSQLDNREKELEARETQVLIKELKYYSPVQPLTVKK